MITYTGDGAGTITDATGTISFSGFEHIIGTDFADDINAKANLSSMSIGGGAGDDTITGGKGDDTIIGGAGEDRLSSGGGNDSLSGGEGDDRLFAGSGNSTLDGGAGNDWFQVDGHDGATTIIGGDGVDRLRADESENGYEVTFTGDGEGTFNAVGEANEGSFTGIEEVKGSGQADTLDASADSSGVLLDGNSGDDVLTGGSGNDTIDGGVGNDSLTGGGGDDLFEVSDGHDTISDFNTGNSGTLDDGDSTNNDFIDLSNYYDHISELYADQADDGILNQSNTTDTRGNSTDYSDNTQFSGNSIRMEGASADRSSFTEENTGVVCFTSGTAIRTPRGDVLIDDLRIGDLVSTADNGPQPIRWIGRRTLDHKILMAAPNLRPVLFYKAVLGNDRPLLVSPNIACWGSRTN